MLARSKRWLPFVVSQHCAFQLKSWRQGLASMRATVMASWQRPSCISIRNRHSMSLLCPGSQATRIRAHMLRAATLPEAVPSHYVERFSSSLARRRGIEPVRKPRLSPVAASTDFFADDSVTFQSLGLHPDVVDALARCGFSRPSLIQVVGMKGLTQYITRG
jgi:hypothetical protein